MSTPAPASPGAPSNPSAANARKPLPWRVPAVKKDVGSTPSCNPNYRPPAPAT